MTRYQLSIKGENLPRFCFLKPSPYAVVTVSGGPHEGTEIGRTETILKANDPDWATIFFIETDASINMPLRISVFNDRIRNRCLGNVSFEATEIFQAAGRTQCDDLPCGRNAKIYVNMEESIGSGAESGIKGSINLEMRGLDIKNLEPGIFGLGRSDPFFEIAKKNVDDTTGVARWNVVYRSEHVENHLNPYWTPLTLGLEKICFCDLDWPIKITIKDHQHNGEHRVIGNFETTTRELLERVAIRGNADRETAFEIFGETSASTQITRGLIVVTVAELLLEQQ